MRKRNEVKARPQRERQEIPTPEYAIACPNDPVNEMVVLAAMLVDEKTCDRLLPLVPTDAFYADEHKAIREAIGEARRRKLTLDPATLARLAPEADQRILEKLPATRPDVPDNLDYHVDLLLWDWRRARVTQGPLGALVEAIQDPRVEREKIRALARQVGDAFDGDREQGRFLRDPKEVVRAVMATLRKRAAGDAYYPYGIDGLDLYEDGTRRLRPGASPGSITLVSALSGSGKALALDTPIATEEGWTTMGDITPGDVVFDEKGEKCLVVAITEIMRGRECFELEFSDGAKIVADADHLWKTISFRERYMTTMRQPQARIRANERRRKVKGSGPHRSRVSETLLRKYAETREHVPEDGSIRTTRQIAASVANGKHRNHAVAVAEPLVCTPAVLPMDPYLLGVWLGDGHADGARITSADPEILSHFVDAGFLVVKKKNYLWSIKSLSGDHHRRSDWHDDTFRGRLRCAGVLGSKHIPSLYLRGSIDQRLALLQGLMDTDGTVSKGGALSFDNTNPDIVQGFEELLASLGIKSKPHEREAKLNGRVTGQSWRFLFCTDLPAFRLPRKLARMTSSKRGVHKRRFIVAVRAVESVPVRCIQVDSPSAMYLAGREMIPTHNSTCMSHLALSIGRQRRKVLFGAWEEEAPVTLEMLATLNLGWSRSRVLDGKSNHLRTEGGDDWAPMTHDDLVTFEDEAHKISRWVRFFDNPFQHKDRTATARRATNDDHLDIVEDHIGQSGCEVFFADLLHRCFVDDSPSGEKLALLRMLAITQDAKIHTIAAHQQRAKDIETRANKRPTREGLIGTGAWLDVPWVVLAPHLPAKWKNVPDDTLEMLVLKQRNGPWPIGIEFDWEPDTGQISGGRSMADIKSVAEEGGVFEPKPEAKKKAPSRAERVGFKNRRRR